jgi:Cu2+-exporting ATPase
MNSATGSSTLNASVCFHCGLPVPAGFNAELVIAGKTEHFCCYACQMVAETIIHGGLENFYQYRETFGNKPDDIEDDTDIDQQAWQQQFIHRDSQGNPSIELLIGGMHCAACTWLLEKQLSRLPHVTHVGVNLAEHKAVVSWRETNPDENFSIRNLLKHIRQLGYHAEPFTASAARQQLTVERRRALQRLGIAGLVMMQVGMLAGAMYTGAFDDIVNSAIEQTSSTADTQWGHWLRWTSLIVSLPILYSAMPIFSGAWRTIKNLQFGMDVSISVALILAFITSTWATISGSGDIYFDAVTMFVFLLLGGRFLEMQARHFQARGSDDIHSLLPTTALKLNEENKPVLLPASTLQIGDHVLIKPGHIVPADGLLISEQALLDESMLTGEATPQQKKTGDFITAGTHNTDQPCIIELKALPGHLRLDHIARITSLAAHTKPRFAHIADRVANYFVITVLLIAAYVLFSGWQNDDPYAIAKTISVLIVSCPCALSLAMPTAIAVATHHLRRKGILITKNHVWEGLEQITDIIFDKTGTLTTHHPRCAEIVSVSELNSDEILEVVAALEAHSQHPIADAFKNIHFNTAASNITVSTGAGISGDINGAHYRFGKISFAKPSQEETPHTPDAQNGWLLLANDKKNIGWIRIEESLKPEAKQLIDALQNKGLSIHLLSGDQPRQVEAIAGELNIAQWQSNATPEEKLVYLNELQNSGRKVLMIGDGINDIPVLAKADISLAVNSANELAKLRADAILLNNDLLPILSLWQSAGKTQKIIRQNLWWALLYNVIAIPFAAMGMIPPWLAAVGMSASSLVVVGNAWRLRK